MSIAIDAKVVELEERVKTLERERALLVNGYNELLNRVVAMESISHTLRLKRG